MFTGGEDAHLGTVIFKTANKQTWRLCPREVWRCRDWHQVKKALATLSRVENQPWAAIGATWKGFWPRIRGLISKTLLPLRVINSSHSTLSWSSILDLPSCFCPYLKWKYHTWCRILLSKQYFSVSVEKALWHLKFICLLLFFSTRI